VSQAILDLFSGLKMSYPEITPERAEELRAVRAQLGAEAL
jgi:hypothetical protein